MDEQDPVNELKEARRELFDALAVLDTAATVYDPRNPLTRIQLAWRAYRSCERDMVWIEG